MKMNITYTNTLTSEEYNDIRASAGFKVIESSLAINGIKNSAFIVCARDGGKAIGMTRVITDYSHMVYIADVVVRPEYQGKGIGRQIMERVMDYINENIAPGQSKFISLVTADK